MLSQDKQLYLIGVNFRAHLKTPYFSPNMIFGVVDAGNSHLKIEY